MTIYLAFTTALFEAVIYNYYNYFLKNLHSEQFIQNNKLKFIHSHRVPQYDIVMILQIDRAKNLPGVGVKCPVEFGRELITKCWWWFKTLILDETLFIVVTDKLPLPLPPASPPPTEPLPPLLLWPPPPPPPIILLWCCSRGGDTGSDFTLICIGDVEGGGVLLDTAKCGRPLMGTIDWHTIS